MFNINGLVLSKIVILMSDTYQATTSSISVAILTGMVQSHLAGFLLSIIYIKVDGNCWVCKDKADKSTSSIAIFVVRTHLEKDQPRKAKH